MIPLRDLISSKAIEEEEIQRPPSSGEAYWRRYCIDNIIEAVNGTVVPELTGEDVGTATVNAEYISRTNSNYCKIKLAL